MENYITLREFMKLPYIVNFRINDYLSNSTLYISKYDIFKYINHFVDERVIRENDNLINASITINGTKYSYDEVLDAEHNYNFDEYTETDLKIIKDCIIDCVKIAEEDFKFNDNNTIICIRNPDMYFDKIEDYYIYKIK